MSILTVRNLTHGFADKNLYKNVSFELNKGEHMGVVGVNGSGKSTFMKIILGELVPDEGMIKWQSNVQIGSLDQYADINDDMSLINYLHTAYQKLYDIENRMNDLYIKGAENNDEEMLSNASYWQEYLAENGFYSIENEINKIVIGLGLDAIGVDKLIKKLSGGQKAKVILGKLLLQLPDVLLLDEPTNFLDKNHVEWLGEYLSQYKGSYIVVSHDYDFLQKISTSICNIEFGTIKIYHGNYNEFVKQKEFLREDYIKQYNAQQKHIKKAEDYIRKYKEGSRSRMARSRLKQLNRLERIEAPKFNRKSNIVLPNMILQSSKALQVKNLEVGYNYPILPKLSFNVAGGEKLVITGFNGIGKSTVLKTLVGEIPSMKGTYSFVDNAKIAYYQQGLEWENDSLTPMDIIYQYNNDMTKNSIIKALIRCGLDEDLITKELSTLSGGEQSKVKLCLMLQKDFNFLIMDEPTNHLDSETKESLLDAIFKFKGSMIVVSHEEKFYKQFADNILNIEDLLYEKDLVE